MQVDVAGMSHPPPPLARSKAFIWNENELVFVVKLLTLVPFLHSNYASDMIMIDPPFLWSFYVEYLTTKQKRDKSLKKSGVISSLFIWNLTQ